MKKFIIFGLTLLTFTSCKMNDALNATTSMNGKMDTLNSKMDQTNSKMDQTNAAINATNHSVHLQTLLVAIKEMRDDKNWLLLSPGYLIMPSAKTFGEEATVQEMVELTQVLKKTIESSLEEYAVKADKCFDYKFLNHKIETFIEKDAEEIKKSDAYAIAYSKCAQDYNINKLATIVGVQSAFGLAPQSKIEALVAEKINTGAAERKYAYLGLQSRYYFLTEIRYAKEIAPSLKSNKEAVPGLFKLGIEVLSNVDYILSLNLLSEMNNFKVTFENEYLDSKEAQFDKIQIKATNESTLGLWNDLNSKLDNIDPKFIAQKDSFRTQIKAGIEKYNIVSVGSVLK